MKLVQTHIAAPRLRSSARPTLTERGLAFLELTIILAIFTPLIVGFVFVWLPDFSRRSNELMNALSSLGGCLVDPINLYRFSAGQAVIRDDYQDVVNAAVTNCGTMSEGVTACGFVYNHDGDQIYMFGMNETPALVCSNINVLQCLGKTKMTTGLAIAFMLSDGTSRCEFVPGTDPGEDPVRGDEASPGGGPSSNCSEGLGYYEAVCQEHGPPLPESQPGNIIYFVSYVCCMTGTTYDSSSGKCLGCPSNGHLCIAPDGTRMCVSNDNPRFANGACYLDLGVNSLVCAGNDQACAVGHTPMCCPTTDTCANYQAANWAGCFGPTPPRYVSCNEGETTTTQTPFDPPGGCSMTAEGSGAGKCATGTGDIVLPKDQMQC